MLLLDEPTYNLDLGARQRLHDMLEDFSGCLPLVGHDRAPLDRMDRIAELDSHELRLYGGDFTAYDEAVPAGREVAERNVRGIERMNLLARFLFRGARAHLSVRALSGGERLRATLACVLCAEPAPHLLLLDEPTNNLDLVSVGQLEGALDSYQGAFLVASHDERFLARNGVDRRLRLADGTLEESSPLAS